MSTFKAALRAAKNMSYEPIEVKVREATNNDPWGISSAALREIARATHHTDEYSLLFKMTWKRLHDAEHVMHVQKALILIEYLLRNGADRFVSDAKRRAKDISALQKYKQYDANNRDVGGDVRAKAKSVYDLLTNETKLADERGKSLALKEAQLVNTVSDNVVGDAEANEEHGGRVRDWEKDQESEEAKPKRSAKPVEPKEEEDEAGEADEEETEPKERKKSKKDKEANGEENDEKSAQCVVDLFFLSFSFSFFC